MSVEVLYQNTDGYFHFPSEFVKKCKELFDIDIDDDMETRSNSQVVKLYKEMYAVQMEN
jgi:hypothetical protein